MLSLIVAVPVGDGVVLHVILGLTCLLDRGKSCLMQCVWGFFIYIYIYLCIHSEP